MGDVDHRKRRGHAPAGEAPTARSEGKHAGTDRLAGPGGAGRASGPHRDDHFAPPRDAVAAADGEASASAASDAPASTPVTRYAPDDSVSARLYWAQHGPVTSSTVLMRLASAVHVDLAVAGLAYTPGGEQAVVTNAVMSLARRHDWTSVEADLGEPLAPIIDAARLVDARGWGPARFEPLVIELLVERYTWAIRASVHRMARRYLEATRAIVDRRAAREQVSVDARRVEPQPDALAPDGPLDQRIAWALTGGAVRRVEPRATGAAPTADAATAPAILDRSDPASVLQRLGILADLLAAIARDAAAFGLADQLAPALAAVETRRGECQARPDVAARWAEQTAAQLNLVGAARDGLSSMGAEVLKLGWGASSRHGAQLPGGDISASLRAPTREVAAAFIAVAARSDAPAAAQQQLVHARQRLAMYPADLLEQMLQLVRRRIAIARGQRFAFQTFDQDRLGRVEAEVHARLSGFRQAIANGDAGASFALEHVREALVTLDLESTIGAQMGAIQALKDDLLRADSWKPDWKRRDETVRRLDAALAPWIQLAALYEATLKAGHLGDADWIAFFQAQLAALRGNTGLARLIEEVSAYAADEATRQKWIAIGLVIGIAIASAITAGLAGPAVAGAGGATAGAIAGTGVEALTFTTLSQGLLAQDPSLAGFVTELGINAVTFGGLRGIQYGAKALAAGQALTMAERGLQLGVDAAWLTATAKAGEAIKALVDSGQQVSPQSAATIFTDNLLMSVAGQIVARTAGKFVGDIAGAEHLPEVAEARVARAHVHQLGERVLKQRNAELGQAMLRADTAALQLEERALARLGGVAANPAEAARLKIDLGAADAPQLAALSAQTGALAAEREIAALSAQVQTYGDHVLAPPEVYGKLIEAHRRAGSEVTVEAGKAGAASAVIRPRLGDGAAGAPLFLEMEVGESAAATKKRVFQNRIHPDPPDGQRSEARRDQCVACVGALMTNRDAREFLVAAADVERDFGYAGSERGFTLRPALEYLQTATGLSASPDPVPFMQAGAPSGHYAIFVGGGKNDLRHALYGYIATDGTRSIYDPQNGNYVVRPFNPSTEAKPRTWQGLLNPRWGNRALPYLFE